MDEEEPLRASAVLNADFSRWYPKFRRCSLRSEVLDLPPAFIAYLHADGVKLPPGCTPAALRRAPAAEGEGWSESESGSEADGEDSDKSDGDVYDSDTRACLAQLVADVDAAIARLGGAVFPKLNWSSPRDAAWVAGGSLKCQSAADVFLLLKSSDFVAHDLEHAFDGCAANHQPTGTGTVVIGGRGGKAAMSADDGEGSVARTELGATNSTSDGNGNDNANDNGDGHVLMTYPQAYPFRLVLRKWCNLHPAQEFRCFVRANHLIAVCQRDHKAHYPFLVVQERQAQLRSALAGFFHRYLRGRHSESSFVFDAYVDRKDKVFLLDLNPFGDVTDALLFEWDELRRLGVGAAAAVAASGGDGACSGGGTESTSVCVANNANAGENEGQNESADAVNDVAVPALPTQATVEENCGSGVEVMTDTIAGASGARARGEGDANEPQFELRVVMEANVVRSHPLGDFRGPLDTVDLASSGGIDAFVAKCRAGGFDSDSDSDTQSQPR
eukprot:g2520.t1